MERSEIQTRLFALQDSDYRAFQCELMPTVDPETVIGVRMPLLRKFAREFIREPEAKAFLRDLPHRYYEENNLHALLIAPIHDYNTCIAELDIFLPLVDNWATCDLISPGVLGKYLKELRQQIDLWMTSDHVYTIRFGIKMLMTHFLEETFEPEHLRAVSEVYSKEYYVNMMIAWFFATALAKQYDAALPYLQKRCLSKWVHNKTIQKAVESYRIPDDRKTYLKTLRIK